MAPPDPPPSSGESSSGDPQTQSTQADESMNVSKDQEQAWTLEEMRKNAASWSLAGDAGLLSYLQEFSQRMISRTHEIEKSVDGLIHDAKLSNVKALNVTNDFIMLANAQFVENRVYDEDVSQEDKTEEKKKTEEQEKTREQRELELVPKITEALKYGLDVIDQAFEKLDSHIDDSDSEDEESTYKVDPILEAKDPYISRPLPYLIGSAQFLQDDNVGLVDEPSEDEEETDHGSISESETEEDEKKDEESSEEYSETESESESESDEEIQTKKSKSSVRKRDDSDSSEGDLFGEKDESADESADEKEEAEESEKMQAPVPSFAAELAAKIGVAPTLTSSQQNEDEIIEDEDGDAMIQEKKHKTKKEKSHSSEKKHKSEKKERRKRTSSKAKHEDEDLFPPNTEDDDDPFSKKGGLFSSSKGLFDSDEEESGGLFGDPEKVEKKPEHKEKTRSRKHSKRKSETVDDDYDEEDTNKPDGGRTVGSSLNSSKLSGSLFADEDDDEDLFAPAPQKQSFPKAKHAKQAASSKTAPRKPSGGLFGEEEEEEDLFASVTKEDAPKNDIPKIEEPKQTKKKKTLPPGAVSMFGGAPNPLAAALKKQQNSEEEDDDDWMEDKKSRSGSLKSNQSTASSASLSKRSLVNHNKDVSPSLSSNSLFAEEPDDDLFKPKSKSDRVPCALLINPLPNKTAKTTQKIYLNKAPTDTSKPKSKPKVSLFDEDEDDFFGGGDSTKKDTKKEVKPKSEPPDKVRVKSDSFFDDDKEEDLFAVTSKPKESKSKPIGGVSLFGGVDVLGKRKDKSEEKKQDSPEPVSPPPRKTTISLFDDDEQDEGEAFFGSLSSKPASLSKEKTKKETQPKSMKKGLFDDEDILFGGAEESPDVDIFGSNSPVHTSTSNQNPIKVSKPEPKQSVPVKGATTSASSTDMFNDMDDEEDLFSSNSTTVKQTSISSSSGPLDIGGVTTTESSDHEKPEVKNLPQHKKPVGGVSMFGGLDPKALKKPSATEEKTEEKKDILVDPLFDEDEDDLFGLPKSKPIVQEQKKPTFEDVKDEVKELPKKPVGGVSMFGGAAPSVIKDESETSKPKKDPLFTNEDDDDDLFGIPKPSVEKNKPELPSTVNKFGQLCYVRGKGNSLKAPPLTPRFGTKPTPKQKPTTTSHTSVDGPLSSTDTVSVSSKKSHRNTDDRGGDLFEDVEDNLFSKSKPSPSEKVKEPSPESDISQKESSPDIGFSKPKKPAGAVSMFGGVDPFVGLKKKESSPIQNEVIENHVGETDAFDGNDLEQASLAFNPATLLPGAAPPVSEPEKVAVGFDEPAQAKTLHSDTKNRAKIQTKRRPPSRHSRVKISESSDGVISPELTPVSEDGTKAKLNTEPRVPDMFGNDDLFGGDSLSEGRNTFPSTNKDVSDNLFNKKSSLLQNNSDVDGELFTSDSATNRKPTVDVKNDSKSSDFDDMFSSTSSLSGAKNKEINIFSDDLFPPSGVVHSSGVSSHSVAQKDSFSTVKHSSAKTEKSLSNKPSKKESDVTEQTDDIFSDIGRKSSDIKRADDHSKSKSSIMDDDIFANSSVLKKKDTSDKNKKSVDLDEEDIFATSTKEKKSTKKKAVTKVEDMLKDDTDIFADIPEVKPKEKKKKKTPNPSTKKTIFKSDIDDIFADAVAPTKTKKEATKKKVQEKKEKKPEDVTDIFDDPLSAIG